jgi:hypothetical protein
VAQPTLRRTALLAGFAAVLVSVGGAAILFRAGDEQVADGSNDGLPGCTPDSGRPAGPLLRSLVREIKILPDDVADGEFTYVRVQSWSVDTNPDTGQPEIVSQDEQLWWAGNRSGRREIRTLSTTPTPPAALAGTVPATRVDTFQPGELVLVVDHPASDARILARQLADHEPPQNGRHVTMRAVADLYRYHALSPRSRGAALEVLAGVDGLTLCGDVTDQLGRTGTEVSVDSADGANRHVISVDAARGALLRYQTVALVPPPRASVQTPGVTTEVLYLAARRTAAVGDDR